MGTGSSILPPMIITVFILGLLEITAIGIIRQEWFVPFSGLYFSIVNLVPMFQGISTTDTGVVDKYEPFFNATVDPELKEFL